jgi:alpha-tubulin suppressor-like RCC1 family protein
LVNNGTYVNIAIKTNGTLWTWGENGFGQLGFNDRVYRSSPAQVGSGTTWSKITNNRTALATKTDGTLWAWGWNARGQLGLGDVANRSSPVQVGSGTTWSQVSNGAGGTGNIATKTDGTLWAWGSNFGGELGLNDQVYRSSPTQVGSGTTWNLINTSQRNTIATKTDGTLWTWGTNSSGGLGQNSIINKSSPVQVGAATNWSLISIGSYSFIAKTT